MRSATLVRTRWFQQIVVPERAALLWLGALVAFPLFTALGAKLQVYVPGIPVPFTLQTWFVMMSGACLQGRARTAERPGLGFGPLSMLAYLVYGALGLPMFAGHSSGSHYLFGMTGGYLLSFPVASALVSVLLFRCGMDRSLLRRSFAFFAASVLILASGALFALLVQPPSDPTEPIGLSYAWNYLFLAFVPFGVVKVVLAAIGWSAVRR